MELVLIAVLLVVVLAGAAFVVTRRKPTTYEADPPLARRRLPPAPAEITETLDEAAPPLGGTGRRGASAEAGGRGAALEAEFRDRLGKGGCRATSGPVLSARRSTRHVDDLEEALIVADVGISATTDILDRLRATADTEGITDPAASLEALGSAQGRPGRRRPRCATSRLAQRVAVRRRQRRRQDDHHRQGR